MAAYNRGPVAKGYVGIPALIFIDITNYGRGSQTYEEKRLVLHKIYSYLRGYLPVVYEKESKTEEYNLKIDPLLKSAAEQVGLAREQYKSTFETVSTCDPDEKIFQETMDGIFERLVEIAAISKVIDKEKMENEEVIF
jgi:hypothetical protein